MPGIIITPGTFNPPAVPVQLVVGYPFPKVPVKTIRKWRQFNPGAVGEAVVPSQPPLPVVYSLFDYINGDITVGVDVETFDGSQPNFTTAGVRYVADALYLKTAQDTGAKTYSAEVSPVFTGGAIVDFGTLAIEQGAAGVSWDRLTFELDYDINIVGDTDLAAYDFRMIDGTVDGSASQTGTALLTLALPSVPFEGGNYDIDSTINILCRLRREGEDYDVIYAGIRVVGRLEFAALNGAVSPTPEPSPTSVPGVWDDTLYGAEAMATPVTEPDFSYAVYVRESHAAQGTLTLS